MRIASQRGCAVGDGRFFVLHGNCLFYYKSEDPSEVIGVMWLEGSKVEEAPEVLEGLYGFTITTLGGREVKLMAETVEERAEWVAAIRDCSLDKTAEKLRTLQSQVDELRAINARAKSDLAQAESARDVLQREFEALLQEHDKLKEQYEALLESKSNRASSSLVVANRGDLEERVRALEMDRDILLRVSPGGVQLGLFVVRSRWVLVFWSCCLRSAEAFFPGRSQCGPTRRCPERAPLLAFGSAAGTWAPTSLSPEWTAAAPRSC